jgi:drug/metabolite transporter (DMT)-like permease
VNTGARYMVLSALSFSVMAALVKLVGQRLPSQEIILARSLVALGLSYVMLRRAGVPIWGQQRKLLVVRALLGFAALSCVFYALTRLPIAEATVLQYLYPVLTAVIAAFALRERVGLRLMFALALGTLGVIVVARPAAVFSSASTIDPLGAAVAMGGSLFTAGAYVLVRRLSQTEHPLVVVFYFPLLAVPLSLPAVALDFVLPRGAEWLGLLGVGLATQAGQVCLTRGLQAERAAFASTISYLQIVFATLWGVLLFDEIPGLGTLIGALLIFAGTLIATRRGQTTAGGA